MISKDKIVTLVYDLYVGEQPEELMEQATLDNPCVYCHGRNLMLPKFEQNLEGKKEDDEFDFIISYADAYGEYDDSAVLDLEKEMFCDDKGTLDSRVKQFAIVPLNTTDGQVVYAQIIEIGEDKIKVDLNHPLAGENLHFKGKIISVRDATEQELKSLEKGCGCGGCGKGKDKNCDCGDTGCCGGC